MRSFARNATCREITPCFLYRLNRKDFDELLHRWPSIEQALEEADKARHA